MSFYSFGEVYPWLLLMSFYTDPETFIIYSNLEIVSIVYKTSHLALNLYYEGAVIVLCQLIIRFVLLWCHALTESKFLLPEDASFKVSQW